MKRFKIEMGCTSSRRNTPDDDYPEKIAISYEKLMNTFERDKGFVNMLIKEGIKEFSAGITAMLDLLNKKGLKDFKEFKILSHSIKGSASNIECIPMSDMAKTIELIVDESKNGDFNKNKSEIRHVLDRMNVELYKIQNIYNDNL